jgi:hypothetical protein
MAAVIYFKNGNTTSIEKAVSVTPEWIKLGAPEGWDPTPRMDQMFVCRDSAQKVIGQFRSAEVVGYELTEQ